MSGIDGVAKLTKFLTGMDMPITNDAKIWLEPGRFRPEIRKETRI